MNKINKKISFKIIYKKIKEKYLYIILIFLLIIGIILGVNLYKEHKKYITASENGYNFALYELVNYVQDVETYLAKSTISSTSEHATETLVEVWREANLALSYLTQLPMSSSELANTAKFLNQVSEYSFSLSRKTIRGEDLAQEDLDNLDLLHDYSVELKNTLNQLCTDMAEGRISWKELTRNNNIEFAQQVDNLSASVFSNIDQNFGEYEGLIYDGAFSEHMESADKKGLTGENITEEQAKEIAIGFIGKERINTINSNGLIENGNIICYDFSVELNDNNKDRNNPLNISIAKKGGHIVLMNYNRNVENEIISYEQADEIGKNFLLSRNIPNMKSTYYLKEGGNITINYAFVQDNVIIYPDLIKLKIALDNGEILGIETSGYLNNHTQRSLPNPEISKEEAMEKLNKKINITSSELAIIPTKWKTEIFCYEFKGKIDDTDFLVYINALTGKEENVLIIIETPNGILTQ